MKKRNSQKNKTFYWILSIALLFSMAFAVKYLYKPSFIHYNGFDISLPSNHSIFGIDVSHYQSDIDWKEVKKMNDKNVKISFAFIKATEGNSIEDSYFNDNWKAAKKNNIIRGAYHYFNPFLDGISQANHFVKNVQISTGDLPPVVDIEELKNANKEKMQKELRVFLKLVENHYGIKPIIYSGATFYNDHLLGLFDDYPLWVAHYTQNQNPNVKRDWSIWQHSESGHVNGINGFVDFNAFKGNIFDLQKLCK